MKTSVNEPLEALREPMSLEENYYVRGNRKWMVTTLLKYIKANGYKPKKLPLWSLNLSGIPWDITNMALMINHCYRASVADLSYPIILDDFGNIADGYHRVIKAVLEGEQYIMAYRLRDMPNDDGLVDNEDD